MKIALIMENSQAAKNAVVHEALELLVQLKRQAGIRKWRGKVPWEGDLEKRRANRVFGEPGSRRCDAPPAGVGPLLSVAGTRPDRRARSGRLDATP